MNNYKHLMLCYPCKKEDDIIYLNIPCYKKDDAKDLGA